MFKRHQGYENEFVFVEYFKLYYFQYITVKGGKKKCLNKSDTVKVILTTYIHRHT